MRFQHSIIKDDIVNEFWDCIFVFKEYPGSMDIIFKNEYGKDITVHLAENMTVYFDRWHEVYSLCDDEYERLLWDVRDIVRNNAYAVSVTVGDHLYISCLMRGEMNSAEDFINDDPAEHSGLYRTGAVIECVYYDNSRYKKFIIEKES